MQYNIQIRTVFMLFSTFRNKSALFFKSWFKIFSHIKTTKGNKKK